MANAIHFDKEQFETALAQPGVLLLSLIHIFPARVVRRNGAKIVDLDQIHIPDPVAQELCRLEHQLDVLRRQVGRLEGRTQDSQNEEITEEAP